MRTPLKHILLSLTAALALTACTDDSTESLNAQQQALLGHAVNFDASMAEPFATRTSYRYDGSFNENDLITIYRQYSTDNGLTFDASTEGYRVYSYQPKTVSGSNVALNTQWKVTKGKTGYEPSRGKFTQTEADSLTWDNGQTVRFRAWGRSNMSGCINGSWNSFYPDFFMSSWVSSSGPSSDVPLTLRHLGCRIGFVPRSGNELYSVELTTAPADYQRIDNANTTDEDAADICTPEEAEKRAAAVEEVYNRMCMPGGIDFETGLKAMSTTYRANSSVGNIETEDAQAQMITFNTKTAEELKTEAVRPVFNNNNGRQYFITIPHDMSTEHAGEQLTLPSYTRFRVYLRDVNSGDNVGGNTHEGTYHILALDDIKDNDGNPLFTDGMTLEAARSYQFTVGYLYNRLTVTSDNELSWTEQDLANAQLDEHNILTENYDYSWWTEAIDASIRNVLSSSANSFNPEFTISNEKEFLSFIRLVNGTAAEHAASYTLERGEAYTDETTTDLINRRWKWYKVDENGERTEITKEQAEADGFVFYHAYYPADGDNAAHYEELVLNSAYSFYSNLVNRKFKVTLTADIDFDDLALTTIGKSESTPFLGIFDGAFHTLSNVYVPTGNLFGHIGQADTHASSQGNGAVVSNLTVKANRPLCLVGSGLDAKILGIRMQAPSTGSTLVGELTGTSYVVGCINEGDAKNALVGKAENLTMYGCMQTAEDLTGGALLGSYSGSDSFFAPQTGTVTWGNFMCNFYDKTHSPSATAVGSVADNYQRQQYIRGAKTSFLCAINDQLITDRETLAALKGTSRFEGFYGLAPWKAMNYAIYRYNTSDIGTLYPCAAHYERPSTTGYTHRYPVLTAGQQTASDIGSNWNVLNLLN